VLSKRFFKAVSTEVPLNLPRRPFPPPLPRVQVFPPPGKKFRIVSSVFPLQVCVHSSTTGTSTTRHFLFGMLLKIIPSRPFADQFLLRPRVPPLSCGRPRTPPSRQLLVFISPLYPAFPPDLSRGFSLYRDRIFPDFRNFPYEAHGSVFPFRFCSSQRGSGGDGLTAAAILAALPAAARHVPGISFPTFAS